MWWSSRKKRRESQKIAFGFGSLPIEAQWAKNLTHERLMRGVKVKNPFPHELGLK